MNQPKLASSLALLDALCNGGSVYDKKGLRYELWEAEANKPGAPNLMLYLEPPRPEPPPDPNANRQKVGWATAVRRLIRNPEAVGYDVDGCRYWWKSADNTMVRADADGPYWESFGGHPEFLYFDKVEAR